MKRPSALLVLLAIVSFLASPVIALPAKQWTVLVFLNADNDLDTYGVADQQEMTRVGSNRDFNLITLIDREEGPATLNFIEPGRVRKIRDMGEIDMGDPQVLLDFTREMIAAYPAQHYCLIIWNHGTGWEKNPAQMKGISYDYSSGNHITTAALGDVCRKIRGHLGRSLDILAMDACLMQMMEVAWEVKDSCRIVVASEETEPAEGYPYQAFLKALTPGIGPEDLAKLWVKEYAASYAGGSQGTRPATQSAIDCSRIAALGSALDEFCRAAMAGAHGAAFSDALVDVQNFYLPVNIDIGDFMKRLRGIPDPKLRDTVAKVERALADAVIANATAGSEMADAQGLAIYFPYNPLYWQKEYANLTFARESLWDEMVQDYYLKTNENIVAAAAAGDLSVLAGFAGKAVDPHHPVVKDLVSRLNFLLFAEGGLPRNRREEAASLVRKLVTGDPVDLRGRAGSFGRE